LVSGDYSAPAKDAPNEIAREFCAKRFGLRQRQLPLSNLSAPRNTRRSTSHHLRAGTPFKAVAGATAVHSAFARNTATFRDVRPDLARASVAAATAGVTTIDNVDQILNLSS
jgi:hypothetical protein